MKYHKLFNRLFWSRYSANCCFRSAFKYYIRYKVWQSEHKEDITAMRLNRCNDFYFTLRRNK